MNQDEQALLSLMAYVYLQNARPDKAAVVMASMDLLVPGQPMVLRTLALAQMRSGKPERALITLDQLAMAGGVDAAFHLMRAGALGALERREESAAAMQAYLALRAGPSVAS